MDNIELRQISLPISEFKGPYRFLSNFYPSKIEYDRRTYATVEHFFQAYKATTMRDHEYVRLAKTAAEAKSRGRSIACRTDWEGVKIDTMRNGLMLKFASDDLAQKLLNTHNAVLIEGNKWHDNFWGDCYCGRATCAEKGYNILGNLLMELRFRLRRR